MKAEQIVTVGTNHFSSLNKAIEYYKSYGFNLTDIINKVDTGEVKLGKPTTSDYPSVIKTALDKDGRWWITHKELRPVAPY